MGKIEKQGLILDFKSNRKKLPSFFIYVIIFLRFEYGSF